MPADYQKKIEDASTLDELFTLWRGKEPESFEYTYGKRSIQVNIDHGKNVFIADGIVNPEVWNSGDKKRILCIMKEAYGSDWDNRTLASWLRMYHPTLPMWRRVARWTYGIQHTDANEIARYKANLTDEQHAESLEQIAILNLKKSNGDSASDYGEIDAYAREDHLEILKEFSLIDPDIVLCGSTFGTMLTTVLQKPPLNDSTGNDNWYYFMNVARKERLFIDYYHPANHWSDLMNYYGLMGIYQQALKEKQPVVRNGRQATVGYQPNVWKNRE